MKLCTFLLGVVLMLLFSGCDMAHGPVIFNDTGHVIEMTAHFADGPSQVRLDPNKACWQLKPERVLESLEVIENGRRREFSREEIQSLLKRVATSEDALLLLRTDTIDVRSVRDAMKEGFFDKR